MSHLGRPRIELAVLLLAWVGSIGCGEVVLQPIGSELVEDGSGGTSSATGGTATGGLAFTECLLEPNSTGWVESQNNPCRAQGPWYSYNDCNDSPSDCTRNQKPEENVFPPSARGMCTTGITAVPANEEETSLKWGAGIALDLNSDDVTHSKLTLGELGLDIIGVRFRLDTNVPTIRVNFPMESTQTTAHTVTDLDTGVHTVYFADAVQLPWVPEEDRVPLKPDQIISIQFQIPTRIGVSYDFDYCIDELTLLL